MPAPVAAAVAPSPVVVVDGLNHFYGEGVARNQVLFDNRIDVPPGQLVVMTGPSGAGKTTLLTLIGALRSVQEGSIEVLGRDLSRLPARELVAVRRDIGFVFQMHNLFDALTAYENVKMAMQLGHERPDDDAPARHRDPRPARPWTSHRLQAADVVGRRAPAGGDRARAGQRAAPRSRRRADGGARPRIDHEGDRPAQGDDDRARRRGHHGDPRLPHHRIRRPARAYGRRPDRVRCGAARRAADLRVPARGRPVPDIDPDPADRTSPKR